MWLIAVLGFWAGQMDFQVWGTEAAPGPDQSALLQPGQVDPERVAHLKSEGFTAVVLMVSAEEVANMVPAVDRVKAGGLAVDYWIEVARNPALADQHPDWMASIQTHPEWRRFFPDFPALKPEEVVKVYPWVPVLYEETFEAHRKRIESLLRELPEPRRLFLNDLQGAPSACGCGHPLCRWTTDYGPIKTAKRLPNDAAVKFVAAVRALIPGTEVIPVWATECEREDKMRWCGGVGCYEGTCWREWTAQLMPLAETVPTLGVLSTGRVFQRDDVADDGPAGWVTRALRFFTEMPSRYDRKGVTADRLLAVVQAWDVSPEECHAQMNQVRQTGAQGIVVAYAAIEQGWKPVVYATSGKEVSK